MNVICPLVPVHVPSDAPCPYGRIVGSPVGTTGDGTCVVVGAAVGGDTAVVGTGDGGLVGADVGADVGNGVGDCVLTLYVPVFVFCPPPPVVPGWKVKGVVVVVCPSTYRSSNSSTINEDEVHRHPNADLVVLVVVIIVVYRLSLMLFHYHTC